MIIFYFLGVICLLVLGAFVFINFYRKDEGFVSDLPDTEDPREVMILTFIDLLIDKILFNFILLGG